MTRRVVSAVLALAALVAIVVGVPVLLVTAVGNPWPGRDAIELGDNEPIFIGALAAVGWVVWARLVAALLFELVEQVRQIREYRYYQQFNEEPEPFEVAPPASRGVAGHLAHRLIIALLVLVPIVRTAPVQASTPDLPTRDSVVQTFDGGPVTVSHIGIDTQSEEGAPTPTVVTAPGDSLMSLAERHLGDASRWREIFEMNRDIPQPGGERLTTPSALRTGWTLELPGDAANLADPGEPVTADAETSETVGDAEVLHAAGVGQPSADPANRHEPADAVDEEVQTYVVQPGDGPWDVAEALLGDGMRFQEVLDANVGHEVAPGHTWTADQRAIHPGWVFSWGPGIESVAPQEVEQREEAEVRDVRVTGESGDTLWGIVDEHSGRDVNWSEIERIAARNDGTATPDGTFAFDATNPDLIHPGQQFVVEQTVWAPPAGQPQESKPAREPSAPTGGDGGEHQRPSQAGADDDVAGRGDTPVPQPSDEQTTETAETTETTEDSHDVPETTPTTAPATPFGDDSSGGGLGLPGPVTLGVGAAALSAGLLTLLEVSRRRRLRTAEIRHRLRTPPAGLVDTERQLRQLGDGDRLVRIDVALRTAVAPLLSAGRRVAAASIGRNGCVVLHADGPISSGLPEPWESVHGSQQVWSMPGTVELDDLAGRSLVDAPCPGLMPIGTSPMHGEVYVDVECAGTLWLDVTDVEAARVLRGVCAGLASSVFAERASLIGVGIDPAWLLGHPNGYTARSVTEAMDLAAHRVELTATSGTSTFELRARNAGGEQWQPAIVVVGANHAAEMDAWRPIPGVAAVVAADPTEGGMSGNDTPWVLRPQLDVDTADASWRLDPLGVSMSPVGLGADEFAAIDELLRWERSPALPPPPPDQQPIADGTEPQRLGDATPPAFEPALSADEVTGAGSAAGAGDLDTASPAEGPSPAAEPAVDQEETATTDWLAPVAAEPDHVDLSPAPSTPSADPLVSSAADASDHLDETDSDSNRPAGDTREIGKFPPPNDEGSVSAADVADRSPGVNDIASEVGEDRALDGDDVGHPDVVDETVEEPADLPPEPTWSLMVRVFGLVDLVDRDGTSAEFRKAKTLELLAWLTLHRDRATRAGARSALWEVDVTDATFSNVVSEARRGMNQLATAPDGTEWLGRTLSSGLPLHDEVISDVDLVEARVERARHQPSKQAIATLKSAVELIRGLPFAETGYLWPDAEGITSRLVVLATSTTTQLADLMLRTDDVDGVFWATGIGLQVLPGHEDLIGLRMRAHAARGDRAGIRQEWETYERVLAADTWSDGEPSPTLVDLRQQLLQAVAQRSADTR